MAYPWTNGYNPYYPVQVPPAPQIAQAPQMPQIQQPQQSGMLCRPVTSPEEAKNTPVDFMGNLMIFPDVQNNRIYTKRWNGQSGMTEFCEFIPAIPAAQEAPQPDFVMQALAALNDKVDALASKIGGNHEQQ